MHDPSNKADRVFAVEADRRRQIPDFALWSIALLGLALCLAGGIFTLMPTA